MREIKFRAWDKADKIMYYDIQNGIHFDDGSEYELRNFLGVQKKADYHEWAVMQYTGLKANGIEIYEGDIVRIPKIHGLPTSEIVWEKGSLGVRVHTFWGLNIFTINDEETSLEIIGNIYENPELLKKTCNESE